MLAALENQITKNNKSKIRAKIIIEVDEILDKNGIFV